MKTSQLFLGRMVIGPLRGASPNANETRYDETTKQTSGQLDATTESDRELGSDEGYSASEEEANVSDRQVLTKNRKRTKSKNGSLGNSIGFCKSAYV